ncbi:MAG: hypothetical protein EOP14_04730 [Pseudomonas sp.]|nr:MAG: hypothetical protein EOP14_04730 [Pseudomonas sp.]
MAVTTVGDRETVEQIDQARQLHMRALNEAMRDLEKSSGKPTLAQRLRQTVPVDQLAATR